MDQAPDLTPGPFDLVFTTWGTICWLPDVKRWAKVIASVLAPGGELYFADAHPAFNVLEEYAGGLYHLRFSNPFRPAAAVRGRYHAYRRPDDHDASINARMDPLALGSARRTDRCRTCNHDVS